MFVVTTRFPQVSTPFSHELPKPILKVFNPSLSSAICLRAYSTTSKVRLDDIMLVCCGLEMCLGLMGCVFGYRKVLESNQALIPLNVPSLTPP